MMKVSILCGLWYLISAGNSFLGKILLSEFPQPLTILLTKQLILLLFSFPLRIFCHRQRQKQHPCHPNHSVKSSKEAYNNNNNDNNIQKKSETSKTAAKTNFIFNGLNLNLKLNSVEVLKWLAALTLLRVTQEFCGIVSVWKSTVSYGQTVKCLMPLFHVLFSWIWFREVHSLAICLSLIPVMTGIGLTTVTELSLDYTGLLAGVVDSSAFSLYCLFIKKLVVEKGLHTLESIVILARPMFLLIAPVWTSIQVGKLLLLLFLGANQDQNSAVDLNGNWGGILLLLVMDGILNCAQATTAALVFESTSVLSYTVANVVKRLFITGLSLLVFSNRVTFLNLAGIFIASGGIFIYSFLKASERKFVKMNDERRKKD